MLYSILAATTAMFFVSWGAKMNLLEKAYVFFISKPFDWSISILFLPINGIFWAIFFYIIFKLYRKFIAKKE
jgi:hypothetical protein